MDGTGLTCLCESLRCGSSAAIQQWVLGQEQSAWKHLFIATECGHSLPGRSKALVVICTNWDVIFSLGLLYWLMGACWKTQPFRLNLPLLVSGKCRL